MAIKNIIFDIGNVLVRWEPKIVIKRIFPDHDENELYKKLHPIWLELNLGAINEKQAIRRYHEELNLPVDKLTQLLEGWKTSQTFLPGSLELVERLFKANFSLYALTDNTKENIAYYKQSINNFLRFFKDVTVSADIGVLKPNHKIYQHLLEENGLTAEESFFTDDIEANVKGARDLGINAFLFTDAVECERQLAELGVKIPPS